MNLRIAINYFNRIYGEVVQLSKLTGYNRFYHLLDYLSAFLFHGVHIRQYITGDMWRMSNPERSRRITYYRMIRLEKKYNNSNYKHLLDNKRDFNVFFQDFIHRDWLYVSDASYDEFKAFLNKYKSIIIKPFNGKKGQGIIKYECDCENEEIVKQKYNELCQKRIVIEELIIQHPDMIFGNTSVNTIRVMTMCDQNGKAHLMKALLRVGVGDTLVDNYAMGGLIYEVSIDNGIIISYGKTSNGEMNLIHPGTSIVMLGYRLPHWEKVVSVCIQAAERIPQIAFVGWDVAISKDSVQLIEGNGSAEYEFYEFLGSSCYYEKIKAILNNSQNI